MSDDSFIREVDEQLREDRAKELWSKYGKLIIAAAVLVVLATAAFRGWEYYSQSQAAASGDRFLDALKLSEEGKHDEAVAAFEGLAGSGSGEYPALSRLAMAGALVAKGDKEGAIAAYDAVVADNVSTDTFREVARLRAGILSVDTQDYANVAARLENMAGAGQPYRHLAREALGIAAMKAGEDNKALEWFQSIVDDSEAAGNVRNRAQLMLDMLSGKGVKASG